MSRSRRWQFVSWLCCAVIVASAAAMSAADLKAAAGPLTVVVMDPLALPLSCPCVKGYAQRDYEKLAASLKAQLGRDVKLVFSESLSKALDGDANGKADLIIGKQSVVLFDAKHNQQTVTPVAMLEGKDGLTTQTGLVVVPSEDPATSVADLKDYVIIFGPEECDEKYAAALELLKSHGVAPPSDIETSPSCSDGASLILEAGPTVRGAAVISSYAKPLLEGCGTIKKGALRVVGETAAVPFVGAFVTESLAGADRAEVVAALLKATADAKVREALETRGGFVPVKDSSVAAAKKK